MAEFADEIGVSRRTVTRYERGEDLPPRSLTLLWEMRTAVPRDWIITGCTSPDLNREPTDSGSVIYAAFGVDLGDEAA